MNLFLPHSLYVNSREDCSLYPWYSNLSRRMEILNSVLLILGRIVLDKYIHTPRENKIKTRWRMMQIFIRVQNIHGVYKVLNLESAHTIICMYEHLLQSSNIGRLILNKLKIQFYFPLTHTHTHTHIYTYIHIYIYVVILNSSMIKFWKKSSLLFNVIFFTNEINSMMNMDYEDQTL